MGTAPPIVFVDCETTGLSEFARPWEIAVIRREPDGTERTLLTHVTYDLQDLPRGTDPYALHVGGWLLRGVAGSDWRPDLGEDDTFFRGGEDKVARLVAHWMEGRPVMVGVGVHFDARMLTALLARHGEDPEPWHYGLLDLKAASWGNVAAHVAAGGHHLGHLVDLPTSSDALAGAAGVFPPSEAERHTALGDARWAARWFDALAGES